METEPSKGNRHDENQIRNKTASPARTRVEFLALVCVTQSADRNLVRLPRRIPSLLLNGDTKMKTTNLKQTSVAELRKWFQRRLHLREFAKNSRIFAAFAPGANRAPQFFFPRKSGSQNPTGIRCADTPSTKSDPR